MEIPRLQLRPEQTEQNNEGLLLTGQLLLFSVYGVRGKAMTMAGYNRRHRMKSLMVRAFVCLACVGLLLVRTPICRAAGSWDAPATELAHQIASLTGPGTVLLTIRNN